MVKILLEVCGDRKRLDRYINLIGDYIDCFDVPESPLGFPSINSVASCVYMKTRYGVCCIAHVRLYDINTVALHSLAKAAEAFGIDGLVLTMGDRPKIGSLVSELTTISAINYLRESHYNIRIGAILSLRYALNDIISRLRIGADFFLVLRLGLETLDKYRKLYRFAREAEKELYPYVIIATDSNRKLLARINQPYIEVNEVEEYLNEIKHYVDGIVLSIPLEREKLKSILEIIWQVLAQ
ncbi:MAG: hypothetical protein DRO40_03735 [Thermoprotei archaeon]|nr:MAG: hypothetical protein DRO40_03735 [Thermoprotei archaeon]